VRISSVAISLLAISCLFGCSDDRISATTGATTTDPTADGGDTTGHADGGDTTGDGDGYCMHQCTSDADCLINGMNVDRTCVDGACTREPCTSDEQCVALNSGWTTPCTSGAGECVGLQDICIDWGGEGLCASLASQFHGCSERSGFDGNPIEVPDIDGNLVIVCGWPGTICTEAAQCFLPCDSNFDCDSDAQPVCDVESGQCECGSDADCAILEEPHRSACNAGSCGCSEDQQCVDANAGDVCMPDGVCGCSGDTACSGLALPFDGGMFSCVQQVG
jgi:hypothetical protein